MKVYLMTKKPKEVSDIIGLYFYFITISSFFMLIYIIFQLFQNNLLTTRRTNKKLKECFVQESKCFIKDYVLILIHQR